MTSSGYFLFLLLGVSPWYLKKETKEGKDITEKKRYQYAFLNP